MPRKRGRSRYLLTVEQETKTESGGRIAYSWSKYTTIWAGRMEFQTGTERFGTGREQVQLVVTWETNFREDLDETMRLKDEDGKFYNIKGFRDPKGTKRELLIDTHHTVEEDHHG